jgi:aromatic ring-cleaving dioxygenase
VPPTKPRAAALSASPDADRRAVLAAGGQAKAEPATGPVPPPAPLGGESPWGYETFNQATPRPVSVRPAEAPTPTHPRPYTDIKSYHAYVYFDEDTAEKAALLRGWVAERFLVKLGDWNLTPRTPHVTPSFYFGYTKDLLHVILPWLQLNGLGLTILLHPNTDDPCADHLYSVWINRAQPTNAYGMHKPGADEPPVELIYPSTKPHVSIETA